MENPNLVDIDGYEGLYKFDTKLNKVFSLYTNTYLKNRLYKSGYSVTLSKNNKKKEIRIINLINPPELPNLDNLKFVDISNFPDYKFNKDINEVYSIRQTRYITKKLNCNGYHTIELSKNKYRKNYLLHRLIFQSHFPNENIDNLIIDHIDRNPLNNNINNLRVATKSQNCMNRGIMITNTSGYKNIVKTKFNTYKVTVTKNGKNHIKSFKTLEEAIEWRNNKLVELHGEFANLG